MVYSPNARPSARRRPKYLPGEVKLLVVFLVCAAFFAVSLLPRATISQTSSLHTRSLDGPGALHEEEQDQCYLVHKASDQCAWVRENCPVEEGGFTDILELYYCQLPNLQFVAGFGICLWLAILFATIGITASDFFCTDLGTIASLLGMSESLAGVTLLAFGNGSPDVFSTFAAMGTGSGSLAIGELYGAAGFISAVVAAVMALVRPFYVPKVNFIRDVGFFAGAAAFNMVFLWDGKLHLWECIFSIAYYIIYVVFVVVWHWLAHRRRKRRAKEAAARGHFLSIEEEDRSEIEPYRDDPDDVSEVRRPSIGRGVSREDFSALERQGGYESSDEEDEEEQRGRLMSELSTNMRVARPNARFRTNTISTLVPVRPSLLGALEFQSAFKSLNKARNLQTIPLGLTRYSDEHGNIQELDQDRMSSISDPTALPPYQLNIIDDSTSLLEVPSASVITPQTGPSGRLRAVSVNDAANVRMDPAFSRLSPIHSEDNLIDLANDAATSQRTQGRLRASSELPGIDIQTGPDSPTLRIEHATPQRLSPLSDRPAIERSRSGGHLAPPAFNAAAGHTIDPNGGDAVSERRSSFSGHASHSAASARSLPQIVIPTQHRSRSSSRATSPFPAYRDHPSPSITVSTRSPQSTRPSSLYLPPTLASPESLPTDQATEQGGNHRPSRLTQIWPYSILPPPEVIGSTLFPAFCGWREKPWYLKPLAVVSAPSVLLLTLSLPVVETERETKHKSSEATAGKSLSWETHRSKSANTVPTITARTPKSPIANLLPGIPSLQQDGTMHDQGYSHANGDRHASIAGEFPIPNAGFALGEDATQPENWNRWLTVIQLYFAPVVCVFAVWIQISTDPSPAWMIKPILISLLVSTVLLVPLLRTTTPTYRPPVYRIILSAVGFVVAVAWISAVASQVVGALKALSVIINLSHAVMGLTIFAIGNSIGDLVADYTVAKLGYQVMALSACFAGPMLNILLGIGGAGTLNLIRGAERRQHKHPDKGLRFKPVHIEVSQTLIVSGFTLLVTLVGLLIAVPLNKWLFDRRIAWALIVLWCISTAVNVGIELSGVQLGELVLLFK